MKGFIYLAIIVLGTALIMNTELNDYDDFGFLRVVAFFGLVASVVLYGMWDMAHERAEMKEQQRKYLYDELQKATGKRPPQ